MAKTRVIIEMDNADEDRDGEMRRTALRVEIFDRKTQVWVGAFEIVVPGRPRGRRSGLWEHAIPSVVKEAARQLRLVDLLGAIERVSSACERNA